MADSCFHLILSQGINGASGPLGPPGPPGLPVSLFTDSIIHLDSTLQIERLC